MNEIEVYFPQRGWKVVEVADVYRDCSPLFRFLQGEGYLHVRAVKAD